MTPQPNPKHRIPKDRLPLVRAGFIAWIEAHPEKFELERYTEGEESAGQETGA